MDHDPGETKDNCVLECQECRFIVAQNKQQGPGQDQQKNCCSGGMENLLIIHLTLLIGNV